MDDVDHEGAAGAETSEIGAVAAPGRERRMTAGRMRMFGELQTKDFISA